MSGTPHEPVTPLCVADAATFWPWRTWTDFARLSDDEKRASTVIVPLAGFADWGLGHALDAEETVLMAVLRAAMARRPADFQPLVIPPLRFLLGPDPGCAFAVDPPTAHAFLREVAQGIHFAGFRRLLFLNASPWNEELAAAASRDLRIEFGLQIFRINLSALALDFHPVRSTSRRRVQTLLTALTGRAPRELTESAPVSASAWGEERVCPLPGPPTPLEEGRVEGMKILEEAAERLAGLWKEVARQPFLPRDGALIRMTTL